MGSLARLAAVGCGAALATGSWIIASAAPAASPPPGRIGGGSEVDSSVFVGGVTRTYLVHVPPAYDGRTPTAVVLAFHGGGGRSRGTARLTGLSEVADRAGFLVVYPQGIGNHWNDGRETTSPSASVDDVGYVRALLARLAQDYAVDARRVFATGMSNGSFFTQRLACELASQIAAVASVAGPLPERLEPICRPARPIAVLLIHGTADPLVPYSGGVVRGPRGGVSLSVAESAAFWARADGCAAAAVTAALPDARPPDGMHVRREVHGGCAGGSEVTVYTVENGGHSWPGGWQYLPEWLVGKTTRALDASSVIWEFFARHPIPEPRAG